MLSAIRTATEADADDLVRVINLAYRVEDFFVIGDRIDRSGVLDRMRRPGGRFLVIDDDAAPVATVFVEPHGSQGYFGLLAVAPSHQGQGLARRLVEEVEAHFRREGFSEVILDVVTLRTELFPFYRKLGYREEGLIPLDGRVALRMPAELRIMVKPLGG
jgi:ribosomal protein S18 acetylase RimI-like enzyme